MHMKAEIQDMAGGESRGSAPTVIRPSDEGVIRWIASTIFNGDTLADRIVEATHGHLGTNLVRPLYPELFELTPKIVNQNTESSSL